MRILLPIEDSNSITHSGIVAGSEAISSTNAGPATFLTGFEVTTEDLLGAATTTPPSRFFNCA